MHDNIIPSELRLLLYNSARYLQQLEIALRLIAIPARYDRPGIDGISMPRLCVTHSNYREFGQVPDGKHDTSVGPRARYGLRQGSQFQQGTGGPFTRRGLFQGWQQD